MLRHPANIVASHLKLKNQDIWRNIFVQKQFVDDHLASFIDEVQTLDHPLLKAGAQVGAFHFVLERQLQDHPDWFAVRH